VSDHSTLLPFYLPHHDLDAGIVVRAESEDLSWIARVMGHPNIHMLHRHYAKYIKDANGIVNGAKFDALFEVTGKEG